MRVKEDRILETETGTASYYADEFNGRKTANGEIYNINELTAAHPSYPFNTFVRVTNVKNGKSVEVRLMTGCRNLKTGLLIFRLLLPEKLI